MKRCALYVLLLTAAAGTLACGLIGGSAPEGPAALVPDGAREMVLVDVSQAAVNRTDLPAELESGVARLEIFGDVQQQASVSLASGRVTITSGDFGFADIGKSLGDRGYAEAEYRGHELWESSDGSSASALLEEDGFLIEGDLEAVTTVLRSLTRDSGLLWNDGEGELKQAMDLTGEGRESLVTTASQDCGLADNTGCRAVAWMFSRGEDRRTVIEGTAALVFGERCGGEGSGPAHRGGHRRQPRDDPDGNRDHGRKYNPQGRHRPRRLRQAGSAGGAGAVESWRKLQQGSEGDQAFASWVYRQADRLQGYGSPAVQGQTQGRISQWL